jgi:hypothetical protein
MLVVHVSAEREEGMMVKHSLGQDNTLEPAGIPEQLPVVSAS